MHRIARADCLPAPRSLAQPMIDALLCNGTTLVVGAAGGIGAGIVRRLAAENVPLALADTDGPQLEQLGEVASDRPVFTMHVDVTSADSVERLVAAVESELGPIGYFVQAAGIQRLGPLVCFSDADFDATFAVNTRGMFLCVRAVATRMLARRMGSIVAIASIEDIAEAVVFLLSERAGHITMHDLVVDGGASLGA
jgi:NAD(P)-dependent dehydrogenase (short-subunit alcohol dehydrogenase family)